MGTIDKLLERLGVTEGGSAVGNGRWLAARGDEIVTINPATGQALGRVRGAAVADYEALVPVAQGAFERWRVVPAPQRGELVRRFGEALRQHKADLGLLVTLETGKIASEGLGEVQEMIDMCDFAVGLSRQLYGLTMPSERAGHRLLEQWHPLGPVGIITAFNFPVAVWAWNAALAAVCGDSMIWKPSTETPLVSVAVQSIADRVLEGQGFEGLLSLAVGEGATVGEAMAADRRLPLISATGSCAMGRRLAAVVAGRLGRTLLELGGNNAAIVCPSADLELTARAVLFAAVGTAGQRCTSLRRLIVHESIAEALLARLVAAYRSIRIGDPWEEGTLLGPLINRRAVDHMQRALRTAEQQGGQIVCGGRPLERPGFFVEPAIVRAAPTMRIVAEETFAPILYVLTYRELEEAIALHNAVPQGLSSAIFTEWLREAELFLSARGSDCGIANVNAGTSGAEIGGAFGGEKDTGGGREAGSDAWKNYMRRQTCTVNASGELPLAQGVQFDLG
jgi:aldehyde dehydrogenase (NAD+)